MIKKYLFKCAGILIMFSGIMSCSKDSNQIDSNVDNVGSPTATISSTESSPSTSTSIEISIDFSESVSGFTLQDITVSNANATNFLAVSGQNYTLDIIPLTDGAIQLSIPAGVAQNSSGNPNLQSNSFSIIYQAAAVTIYYQENFDEIADATSWPSPWTLATGSNAVSTIIQSGRACLEGQVLIATMDQSGQDNLVRLLHSGLSVQDFEARFDIFYDDFQNQGVGFYGRQNGGFFNFGVTPGQGYGLFLKGYTVDQLMFWYELLGDEIPHQEIDIDSILSVNEGQLAATSIHVVYQVEQISATETRQRAKIWLFTDPEPSVWQIVSDNVGSEIPSTNPMSITSLQNQSDGFAIDLFNSSSPSDGVATTQSVCIDNLLITDIP